MKRFFVAVIMSVFIVSCAKNTSQVLLFMRDGSPDLEYMLKREVSVMIDTLEGAGFTVVVATFDGSTFAAGSTQVKTDVSLADVDIADYAGFILPCMAAGTGTNAMIPAEMVDLVQKAVSAGKPVAAQTGSIMTLRRAGLLNGKKYANLNEIPELEGATYTGTGVVRDGLIVTSAICPYMARDLKTNDGTEQLALLLIEAMKDEE